MDFRDYMTHSQAYLFLEIPTHRLRYLEKKGLITPEISPLSGHRLYKKEDLEKLKLSLETKK